MIRHASQVTLKRKTGFGRSLMIKNAEGAVRRERKQVKKTGRQREVIEEALRLAPPKTKLDAIRIQRVSWQAF